MTVLVDPARWQWRGRTWAHLVSDRSAGELHQFALSLGLRRLAFQGDHYDIDAQTRERAIAQGAEAVDSRDLVRRLRASGLRHRGGATARRWETRGVVVHDARRPERTRTAVSVALVESPVAADLIALLDTESLPGGASVTVLTRAFESALVIATATEQRDRVIAHP